MKRSTKLMLASPIGAAALALAACGDNEANEAADVNLADSAAVDTPGTEADLDVNTLRVEVDRLRLAGSGGTGTTGAAGTTGTAGQSGTTPDGGTAGQDGGTAGTGTEAASNQSMGNGTVGATFAEADLDGDGQITPAEYAVRELDRVDPAQKAAGANDEMRPYVSDEALNRVIDSFRKLDANGDFRLSEAEFGSAAS